MTNRPFEWKRDGGGLVLFVVGAFVSVLMVKALASDQPLEQGTGTAAIAAALARSFGALPWLVFAAGIAFLGARSFVTASEAGALRHALGLAGITVGLSIALGAFSDSAGGAIGAGTGGRIALMTHATLGGLAGLVLAMGTAWFTWMREPRTLYEEQIRSSVADRAQVADPGVTAAEAAGLIPEELPHSHVAARRSSYFAPASPPPSPYPEDVRLKGQVPAGARPIATTNAASAYSPSTRTAPEQHDQPDLERAEPFEPGADLAEAAASAAPWAEPADSPLRDVAPDERAIGSADEELSEPESAELVAEETLPANPAVRPTWEQTGLGEDDEPVDAYGTPLSLVESLRKAQEELVALPESTPEELEQAEMAESEEFAAEEGELDELEEEELEVEELIPASEIEEPVAESKALAQTTIFDFTGEAQSSVELFPEPPAQTEPLAEPVAELQAEPEPEPADEIEIEVGEEPEMVLQPQAAPAERAHKPHSVDPDRAKFLAEAGCLFLERGRVAVSMLQKQYAMDFDDACKVLDELQDLGLIGPYLGEQSRDILLTRDQWLEKAGAI